jgi:hypothetical protein
MRLRRRCGAEAAVLPVASAPLRSDWVRVFGGATGDAVNLVPRASAPHLLLLFGAARREPTCHWLGCAPPIRARNGLRIGRWTDPG